MQADVLVSTNDMTHEQWLEMRRKGIGGSDVGAILGQSKWKSPMEVYLEKTGEFVAEKEIGEAAYWGNVLEEVVAKEFEKQTGLKVRKRNAILQNRKYPWMLANVDRLVVGQEIGLECKTASEYLVKEWIDDEVPASYILQCQHYMAVTGYESWYIAVLIGGNKFKYKLIERDEGLIEYIVDEEKKFWLEHVEKGLPVEFDGSQASSNLLKLMYPEGRFESETELPNEADDLIKQFNEATSVIKMWEEQKKQAENKLKDMLGEFEVGQASEHVVTWKTISPSRVDIKLLKENYPDVYQEVQREKPSRRFLVRRG